MTIIDIIRDDNMHDDKKARLIAEAIGHGLDRIKDGWVRIEACVDGSRWPTAHAATELLSGIAEIEETIGGTPCG